MSSNQGYYKSQKDVKALEDRIAELEYESKRLKEERLAFATHAAELEATIERVRPLPDKWRSEKIRLPTSSGEGKNRGLSLCAEELDEALTDSGVGDE